MTFVTKLALKSGDRPTLDRVVDDIKSRAERKGVELKGPHPQPPTDLNVPLSKHLAAEGETFDSWRYTVYTRTIEVVGHDGFARSVTEQTFPEGVHVQAEIDQTR